MFSLYISIFLVVMLTSFLTLYHNILACVRVLTLYHIFPHVYHLFLVVMLALYHIFLPQGDLGAIDEQYDIAISTACGPLDNIVVDRMDTAVKCVEYLRRNNVGVATFIGLDKVVVACGCGSVCNHASVV